jgi:signal transduction histidine kinase
LPASQALESALDRADDVIVEGRDRVKSLRADKTGDLHEILAELVERLGLEPAVKVRMVVEGPPRRLHPLVCEEIERIASEALFNAQRHAQAHNVEIAVAYGRRALTVLLRDDGVGLDQAVLDSGPARGSLRPDGHERAGPQDPGGVRAAQPSRGRRRDRVDHPGRRRLPQSPAGAAGRSSGAAP